MLIYYTPTFVPLKYFVDRWSGCSNGKVFLIFKGVFKQVFYKKHEEHKYNTVFFNQILVTDW